MARPNRPSTGSSPALRFFGDARSRSIWQWQLILAFAVVAIVAGVALLTPDRLSDWRFGLGTVGIIIITCISLGVPWHRLDSRVVLALPVLDSIAIAMIAAGNTAAATFLWVFPIAWVASYYATGVLIGLLALIAVLRLFNLFLLGVTVETVINMTILLITLGFVAVVMAVGTQRDLSSRRLLRAQSDRLSRALERGNEQRARTLRLMNSLDIGLARVGTEGVVEVSNDAFRRVFDLDSAHTYAATAVEYRARRGDPVPAGETSLARAARGELFDGEVRWLFGLDGTWRAIRTSTKSIGQGLVTGDGLLLIVEDVTDTIDPHAEREATRRSISHELRNPLTAVLGHIDLLLERGDLDPAVRGQLDVVERAGSRMEQLINDALVTPEARRDDSSVDFDLADISRASLEAFGPTAETSGVTLRTHLDEALCTHGDAFRLRQVVDNVVGNAIKYAQRGGRVSVRGFRPNNGEVALRVSDNGIGISAKDLPRIFEREFRAGSALDLGIPGTGLGLSIAHDIITSQGGRFEVESEIGLGTTITLVLPAVAASAAETSREGMPA